jgi:PEGA domain
VAPGLGSGRFNRLLFNGVFGVLRCRGLNRSQAIRREIIVMHAAFKKGLLCALLSLLVLPVVSRAQNEVMGRLQFVATTDVDKKAGVWIDGQYVGYVDELKGNKEIFLLPGEHEVSVRQSGYTDFTEKLTVEPGKEITVNVSMEKDPRAEYSAVTSEIKLKVSPDRAAVFVDGAYAGTAHEFGGIGRAMLVAPGKHHVKIDLPGYRTFDTDVNLLPHQKLTIKTKLEPGSITQADPELRH